MKCVILQPSYIPWRGYFHQIAKADLFIFYDDVQYDARGWRNRNRIKTAAGPRWLTIPVHRHGVQQQATPIHEIRIANDRPWAADHWNTIRHSYARAPHFARYQDLLAPFYASPPERLADFTIGLTVALAGALGIAGTRFVRSSTLPAGGSKTERLINLLRAVGADHYISGPSAQAYIDPAQFQAADIRLEYMAYNYREYPQLYPPFEPQVSVLDLLFMAGPDSLEYILT